MFLWTFSRIEIPEAKLIFVAHIINRIVLMWKISSVPRVCPACVLICYECSLRVVWVIPECAMNVLWVCSECALIVLRACSGCVLWVWVWLWVCSQSVLKMCSECAKGVLWVCCECSLTVLLLFSECALSDLWKRYVICSLDNAKYYEICSQRT